MRLFVQCLTVNRSVLYLGNGLAFGRGFLLLGRTAGWRRIRSGVPRSTVRSVDDSLATRLIQTRIVNKLPLVVVVLALDFLDGFFLADAGYANNGSATNLTLRRPQTRRWIVLALAACLPSITLIIAALA